MKEAKDIKAPNGAMHAVLYPFLAMRAIDVGYAVALHGSVGHDLDLIAVPWTDAAVSAEELVEHLCRTMDDQVFIYDGSAVGHQRNGVWGEKPHGRRVWSLHLKSWSGSFIDVSVMPRTGDGATLNPEEKA
jgi:hypothetical protein